VPELQVSELAAPGTGGKGGEPVAVDIGEPQLRPAMRALLADDDPHAGRPVAGVQQAGMSVTHAPAGRPAGHRLAIVTW
jgi:hypothetical protein